MSRYTRWRPCGRSQSTGRRRRCANEHAAQHGPVRPKASLASRYSSDSFLEWSRKREGEGFVFSIDDTLRVTQNTRGGMSLSQWEDFEAGLNNIITVERNARPTLSDRRQGTLNEVAGRTVESVKAHGHEHIEDTANDET